MRVVEGGRLVVPAGEPAARRWAEEHLLSLHGRRRRLLAAAGWVRLRPERVIDVSGPGSLLGLAADELAAALVAAPRATPDAPWVLLHGHEPAGRRGLLVVLERASGEPAAVVKMRPAGAGDLAREAGVLEALVPALPAALAAALPRPLGRTVTARHELLVLTPVPGRALSLAMQRTLRPLGAHLRHLEAAGRWLARLHQATDRGGAVAVHGDPWPRNLLYRDGELTGVVDWEHGRLGGGPEEDLFALPLLLAIDAPRWRRAGTRAEGDAFAAAFLEGGALGAAVGRYLDAYRRERGVDPGRLREWLETFIDTSDRRARSEEHGWRKRFAWPAMRARLTASRAVFSG